MVLCNPMYIATHVRKVHGVDENGKAIPGHENCVNGDFGE
jgi:hypothetical protein